MFAKLIHLEKNIQKFNLINTNKQRCLQTKTLNKL